MMLPPPGRPRNPNQDPNQNQPSEDPIGRQLNAIPPKPLRRASRAPLTQTQRQVHKSELLAFSQLETELGGRGKLVQTLLGADLPPRMRQFLGAVCDPESDRLQLGHIAAATGVTLPSLQRVFMEARKMRGLVLATERIAEHTPAVAAAVMEAAVPGPRQCKKCLGAKRIEVINPENKLELVFIDCPTCEGVGEVFHEPDHDVQKTALKISGLLTEGKGIVVNQQQFNRNSAGADPGFEKMMAGLDNLLFGVGRERTIRPGEALEEGTVEGELLDQDAEPDQNGATGEPAP